MKMPGREETRAWLDEAGERDQSGRDHIRLFTAK